LNPLIQKILIIFKKNIYIIYALTILIIILYILIKVDKKFKTNNCKNTINKDTLRGWELESFSETNAYVIIIYNVEKDQIYYSSLKNCLPNDYFEAASLSKVLFARLAHDKLILNKDIDKSKFSLISLLRHENISVNGDKCKFKYSDSGYLLAGEIYKKILGHSFEVDVEKIFPLRWTDSFNSVNGFIRGDSFFRNVEKYDTALPNGTLYLNYNNSKKFIELTSNWAKKLYERYYIKEKLIPSCENKTLLNSNDNQFDDNTEHIPVCGFKKLFWLNGIGVDESLDRPIVFQWGCNWCYNNILLYDLNNSKVIYILTNSIIGAHEISQFSDKFFARRLELFDYIGWW
jgi:hypothetical protein